MHARPLVLYTRRIMATSLSHLFPPHWTIPLAKHSPMMFANVLEGLFKFAVAWDS